MSDNSDAYLNSMPSSDDKENRIRDMEQQVEILGDAAILASSDLRVMTADRDNLRARLSSTDAGTKAEPNPDEARAMEAVVEAADRWEKYSTQRSEEECGNSDGNILRRAVLALRAQKARSEKGGT